MALLVRAILGRVSHGVEENCLYDHAAYVGSWYHWIISIGGRCLLETFGKFMSVEIHILAITLY